MPMTAFASIFASFKTASDLTKTIISLHDAAVIRDRVVELQGVILSAQSNAIAAQTDQLALLEQVGTLEEQVANLEAWETEKKRYKLEKVGSGALVYAPKDPVEPPELPHYLCANCYQKGYKSILQPESRYPGRCSVLVCHRCGNDIYLTGGWQREHSGRIRNA